MNEYSRLRRLNHLFAQIDVIYHEAALHMGLSDSAMMVLYTLCIEGGSCLIGKIISQSNISKQTLNSALRMLEKEGLRRSPTRQSPNVSEMSGGSPHQSEDWFAMTVNFILFLLMMLPAAGPVPVWRTSC